MDHAATRASITCRHRERIRVYAKGREKRMDALRTFRETGSLQSGRLSGWTLYNYVLLPAPPYSVVNCHRNFLVVGLQVEVVMRTVRRAGGVSQFSRSRRPAIDPMRQSNTTCLPVRISTTALSVVTDLHVDDVIMNLLRVVTKGDLTTERLPAFPPLLRRARDPTAVYRLITSDRPPSKELISDPLLLKKSTRL